MREVIKNYKSVLDSGPGLRDMLNMIKERYPWSLSKRVVKIFISLLVCLITIGLYVFDITTDIKFSLKMLHGTHQHHNLSDADHVEEGCELEEILSSSDMKFTGWIAVWHCIKPFVVSIIVFLSMYCSCSVQKTSPGILSLLPILAYGDLLMYSSELISQDSNISYQQNSGQRKLTENRKIHFDPFPDTYIS